MRKTTIIAIILTLITVLFFVIKKGVDIKTAHLDKTEHLKEETSKNIPLFEFTTLEGGIFSKYNLIKNKATIIVYFDPDCSLCEKSGTLFSKFESLHKNANVLFVSPSSIEKIKNYQEQFNLKNITNITFLQCKEDDFYTVFKESGTPTYLIYSKNQKLVKIINDDVPVKIILRYMKAAQIEA
jgi:peroxiredoxin